MVWAGIGYHKKTDITFVETTMKAIDYQQMVALHLPTYGNDLAGIGWKLQQDNAPAHAAKSTLEFFKQKKIDILEKWPPKSADMNIIENFWSILAQKVYKDNRQFENKTQLKEAIVQSWLEIAQTLIHKLFDNLPRRINELMEKKGKETKY
jgi:DDE superfamily endonuclease